GIGVPHPRAIARLGRRSTAVDSRVPAAGHRGDQYRIYEPDVREVFASPHPGQCTMGVGLHCFFAAPLSLSFVSSPAAWKRETSTSTPTRDGGGSGPPRSVMVT